MRDRVKKFLSRLHKDESGAMSVEKILILALVSIPIIVILLVFFNTYLKPQFQAQQDALNSNGGNATP